MKFNLTASLLVTLLGVQGISQTASAQSIFNASPSAVPGEAISLQGDFSHPVSAYMSVGTSTTPISMPVRVQGNGQATVEVPTNVAHNLYKVWVQNSGQTTAGPAVYINRAWGMHYDSPEVYPKAKVRIFGRNLKLNGAAPEVYFVARNTTTRLQATVNASESDAYVLSVTAPDGGTNGLQPDTTYDVLVRNGFGGAAGETTVEQPLQTIPKGEDAIQPSNDWEDYFQLDVPWATKFNFYGRVYNVKGDSKLTSFALGNGTNNDQPAIQAAINKAHNDGGGIVYLPSGTYKLLVAGLSGLEMRSKVVLMGESKTSTIIKYGYGTTGFKYGVSFTSGECMGISDLSIQNVNEEGKWRYNMTAYPGALSDVFLKNVNFTYSGEAISFIKNGINGNATHRLLIEGCSLTSKFNRNLDVRDLNNNVVLDGDGIPINSSQGPLTLVTAADVILRDNTIKHEVGQTGFNDGCRNIIIEGNNFIRDAAIGQGANPVIMDTRDLSLNFASNVAILDGHFETINGAAYNKAAGETILSEGGGPNRKDAYYGNVTGATNNTLTTSGNSWGNLSADAIVVIISGKGAGQWRRITARYVDTLQVDRNWDLNPDTTSRYSITDWSASNWLIRGNTAVNNRAGIELYAATGNNLAIVDNHLTNNDGILLRTAHSVMVNAETAHVLNVISNTQVIGNTVTHTAASPYSQIPAYIGILALQEETSAQGAHTFGVEIKGNTVTGLTGYTPLPEGTIHYPNNNKLNTEGFYNYYISNFFDPAYPEGGQRYFGNNGDTPIMVGTIFQNNTAVNCSSAVHINSGAYNTLICSTTLVNTPNLISDTYAGNSPITPTRHKSVNTVICPHTPTTPSVSLKSRFFPRATAAGRMVNGKFQGSDNNSAWTDLGTITSFPSDSSYTELGLGSTLYRYLRYLSPDNGYCNIAELEFWNGSTKLTGTGFGTAGAWGGGTDTFDKALDGNTSTAFDSSFGSGAFVGIDRGAASILRTPENPTGTEAGLRYGYYEGSWSVLPNFSTLTPISTNGTSNINLGGAQRNWGYGLQFTGYITVPTDGIYTFYTNSDDGSKLYIGSTEVVDNDGGHSTQEHSGTIGLQTGTHAFRVVYFQSGGGETLNVSYEGPSISKQAIPNSAFRRIP